MPAHIKRRKDRDGTFYLIDGRLTQSLKTKVKRFAEARLQEYNRGKFSLEPKITVGEYYERWIKTKCLSRKSALRDYKQHFSGYLLSEFGSISLATIRVTHLSGFLTKLLGRGLSVKTCRNILAGSFRALWKDAIAEEIVDKNPLRRLRWPAPERLPPDPFTIQERDKILAQIRQTQPFYYPFVYTMFFTGMRPSEAVALRLSDVAAQQRTISITKSRHLGADAKPKTSRSRRLITIPAEVIELLEALRLPWQGPDSHVFYNKFSGGPLEANQWARVYWRKIIKCAGVRPRKFYATRHTFITEMVQRGENIKAVADYCGTSVEMIERNYCGKLSLSHLTEIKPAVAKSLDSVVVPTGIEPAGESEHKFPNTISPSLYKRLRIANAG